MGNEYYGRNDYRDYLAHYGVKGMKWKKVKKRALTPEEIKALKRTNLQEHIVDDMNKNAKNKAKLKRLSKKAAGGKAFASGKWGIKRDKHIAVTSGRRVESNVRSFDPNKTYVVSSSGPTVIKGSPVKKGKKIKSKLKSASRKSIKKIAKSASVKKAYNIIEKMR